MIEVQLITMGGENPDWLAQCKRGLQASIVRLHEGHGIKGNVNGARMTIWDSCAGDILSFVDPDDVPSGYAWDKIQSAFNNNPKAMGVYTLE